jgi:hypothetical protein
MPDLFIQSDAGISECGLYRYWLTRTWGEAPPVCWVALNPSTADAVEDDPTIRRIMGFSRLWCAGGIVVVNLFALRATDPRVLRKHLAPVGPDNDRAIVEHAMKAMCVVAAWGADGSYLGRDREVLTLLKCVGVGVKCLGVTKEEHPRHPLYLRADTPLVPFPPAGQG